LILDYKIRNSFSRTYIGRTELIHHQVRQQFLQNIKLERGVLLPGAPNFVTLFLNLRQ